MSLINGVLLCTAHDGIESASEGVGVAQPFGQMTWVVLDQELPSFPNSNTMELSYTFPDGIQSVRVEACEELTSCLLCLFSPLSAAHGCEAADVPTAGVPFQVASLVFLVRRRSAGVNDSML